MLKYDHTIMLHSTLFAGTNLIMNTTNQKPLNRLNWHVVRMKGKQKRESVIIFHDAVSTILWIAMLDNLMGMKGSSDSFLIKDLCCPREYAAEQWRSVHELCLPNVEMDLSAVKVPIPLFGTSLIVSYKWIQIQPIAFCKIKTEFDFSKTDKWRFECRYGGHVQQYSFFEKSASEEDESEGGGEID